MISNAPWICGVLSAILFAMNAPFAKLLMTDLNPALMAAVLYLGSGFGLMLSTLFLKSNEEAPIRKNDIPWLVKAIVFGGIIGPLCLMFGLRETTASSASLLLNMESVLTAVIAWVIYREHCERRQIFGMSAIALGGCLISAGSLDMTRLAGNSLVVAACLCWAIDNNLTRHISASDPVKIAMFKGLFAGATNLAIAHFFGVAYPEPIVLIKIGLLGYFSYGLSLVLFIMSLRLVGTSRSGAYFSTAPFLGALVSWMFFKSTLTVWEVVAFGCMAFGLWIHITENHEHEHSHEECTHEHSHVHDEHHQHKHAEGTDLKEPHSHEHFHPALIHKHPHFPDIHHRHSH